MKGLAAVCARAFAYGWLVGELAGEALHRVHLRSCARRRAAVLTGFDLTEEAP